MDSINLAAKLETFTEHFQPRTVGQFNGHDLMVAKLKGPFVWHKHDDTDDFFLVLRGTLIIQMREGNVTLRAGEMFVVPRGVEHCPVAVEETHLLLIEQRGRQPLATRELLLSGASRSSRPWLGVCCAAPERTFMRKSSPEESDAFSCD